MNRLRKVGRVLGLTMLAVLLALAAGGYLIRDRISPELRRHAANVWQGKAPLTGERTTGEFIRYAVRRLEGHPNLESLLLPPLHWLQARAERPVPAGPLPALGKGQQAQSLQPLPGQTVQAEIQAASAAEIVTALSSAKAGQTVLIKPGTYRLNGKIETGFPGSKKQPITVRASAPGQVNIEFDTVEGFAVSQAFWIFENLTIRGVCKEHDYCEHAFHVFGKANHTVIRNNLINDFNAHIKVNGLDGDWPDNGLVQFNTLTNTKRRETHLPVTPVDIVGANQWTLADNLVTNFIKGDGDKISYGMFMKGAGRGGRIERNLIVCTPQDISQPGSRVGLSFGGGGTGKAYCRDQRCDAEYTAGLAANNIVAHCNDFGIDVNQSSAIVIAHNTLINTAGIDVRRGPASAQAYGNLLDGRIRQRDGGQLKSEMNELLSMQAIYANADALELGCRKHLDNVPSIALVPKDFNSQARSDGTLAGALGRCDQGQ